MSPASPSTLLSPASSYSLFFGILALLSLPLTLPMESHLTITVLALGACSAVLALLFGAFGLLSRRADGQRWKAVVGILFGVLCFVAWGANLPEDGGRNQQSAVMGDVRTVISAQQAYASANGGSFDTLECLAAPHTCLSGYPETAPTFLDSTLASRQPRLGYERHFIAGPRAEKGLSPSSLVSFGYVAVPLERGKAGVRGYCGDSEGMLCMTDGRMPQVVNGRCNITATSGCEPVR